VLLMPFAMANVAGWMCSPGVLGSKARFFLHRFVVRFAALVMTLNVVVLLVMTGEDLIGARCSNNPTCRGDLAIADVLHRYWFTDHTGRAMAAGAMLPVIVLLVFYVLSRVSTARYERVHAPAPRTTPAPAGEGTAAPADVPTAIVAPEFHGIAARPMKGLSDADFWHGYQAARRLSALHLAAGLAVTAGVLAWTTHKTLAAAHGDPFNTLIVWLSAGVLTMTVLSLFWDTTGPWWTRLLVSLSVIGLVAAVVDVSSIGKTVQPPAVVAGMRWVANGTYVLVGIAIVLTALVVAVSRGRTSGSFVVLGPAVVLAFAFGVVNAVGALIIMRLGSWVGFPALTSPKLADDRDRYMYTFINSVAIWTVLATTGVIVVFALVAWLAWWRRGHQDNAAILDQYQGVPAPSQLDAWTCEPNRDDLTKDDCAWLGKVARARLFARLPRRADLLLLLIVLVTTVTIGVVEYLYWRTEVSIQPPSLLATGASYLAAAAPLALMAILRWGWRNSSARKHIGVAWDVATFWPRAYHPFAPPCYAERAVPDLQWRLWYLQDQGAEVTVVAHSQGTVLAAAALLQQESRKPKSSVGLLTFGSPLDTLYKWAFPAYFNDDVFREIRQPTSATEPACVRDWRNAYYLTDYIGRTKIAGADNVLLPDPPNRYYVISQPRPSIGSHGGYWTDPAVWKTVET
jgi:hypothetical protein